MTLVHPLHHHQVRALATDNTDSMQQLVIASFGTAVLVLTLAGELLQTLHDAHTRPVAAMLYYDTLKLLVTAGSDGESCA
jgi:hypothetical protein